MTDYHYLINALREALRLAENPPHGQTVEIARYRTPDGKYYSVNVTAVAIWPEHPYELGHRRDVFRQLRRILKDDGIAHLRLSWGTGNYHLEQIRRN